MDKEKRIKKLLAVVGNNSMTVEEVAKYFAQIINFVKSMKSVTEQEIGQIRAFNERLLTEIKAENENNLSTLKEQVVKTSTPEVISIVSKLLDSHTKTIESINKKMDSVRDGKDADEERVVRTVLEKIPKDTPEQIRNKLESLTGEEKLSIQAIGGLSKMLEGLKGRGSFGLISQRIRFVDDETPSGTVNGSNKNFTISRAPATGSLKVYVNGQRMRVTEDYTLTHKTIAFVTAPPTSSILLVDYRF